MGSIKGEKELNQTCYACKKSDNNSKIIEHHISYYPEIKVPVHNSCHTKIHRGTAFQELRPNKDDVDKFYGTNYSNRGKRLVIDISRELVSSLKHKAIDEKITLRELVIKTLEKLVK